MHTHPLEKFNQYPCPVAMRYHFIHVLQGCSYWCLKLMLTAGHVKATDSTCSLALPPNLKQSIKRVTGADGFLSLTVDPESFPHWLGGSGSTIQLDGTCGTGWSDHERRAINLVPVSCHDAHHSNTIELETLFCLKSYIFIFKYCKPKFLYTSGLVKTLWICPRCILINQ